MVKGSYEALNIYLQRPDARGIDFFKTHEPGSGILSEILLPRATLAKLDPVPNKGLKVFHMGLGTIAFTNQGDKGLISVRIIDGDGEHLG